MQWFGVFDYVSQYLKTQFRNLVDRMFHDRCFSSFSLPDWRLVARLSMVAQRNPLYSAISLIGVFISLACLYVMLAAPFIAAVQVIVYAGAIMVLVVFVIMLLNVEEEERRPQASEVSRADWRWCWRRS